MGISEHQLEYLQDHHAAAMITVGDDGVPKAVRIGVSLIDGRLWASGTQARARTERLRRDPRCTLFVFDDEYGYLHWKRPSRSSTAPMLRPSTFGCSARCKAHRKAR